MSHAFNVHANWRDVNPRWVMQQVKKHKGTVLPYARNEHFRSFVVVWPDIDVEGNQTGCEGNLYIVRCYKPRLQSYSHGHFKAKAA